MRLLRLILRLFLVSFFVLSLALNVAFFMGGALYKLASAAVSAATGIRTVAVQHADKVALLNDELAKERATTRKLKAEIADPSSRRVHFRGKQVPIRDAVDVTSSRISKRAVVSASREVGSMAAEAMPYIGVAVIVGVTALELKDLCDTLKDMNELKRAITPESSPGEEEKTVCAINVQTREELWAKTKASPQMAWDSARNALPTLEEIKGVQFPDIDWQGAWSGAVDGAGGACQATKTGAGQVKQTTGAYLEEWFLRKETDGLAE